MEPAAPTPASPAATPGRESTALRARRLAAARRRATALLAGVTVLFVAVTVAGAHGTFLGYVQAIAMMRTVGVPAADTAKETEAWLAAMLPSGRHLAAIVDGRVDLEPLARRASAVIGRDFHLDAQMPAIEGALARASARERQRSGTSAEAYRLALLAEKLAKVLVQEAIPA